MRACPTCQAEFEEDVDFCTRDGSPLKSDGDPLIGTVLAERYRIVALMGEGGMGCVYQGEHVILGRKVAIKVLRPELSQREDLMRRFQMEAVGASRIGHENIVDVTDFGRTPQGSLYFVMEYLGGESLSGLLRRTGRLPVERALPILHQVAKALAAAHAQSIVHRDLKADNVVLVQREEKADHVKVLDFGISKFNDLKGENLTRIGAVMGTPEYMAPEQAAGAVVDTRADIYSLGILGYEILTGNVPFVGETVVATLMMHQQNAPAPLRSSLPNIPVFVEELVLRMLEKRREDRPQAMTEVGAELSRCMVLHGISQTFTPPPPLPMEPAAVPWRSTKTGSTRPPRGPSESAQRSTLPAPATDANPPATSQTALPDDGALYSFEESSPSRTSRTRFIVGAALVAAVAILALVIRSRGGEPGVAAQLPPVPHERPAGEKLTIAVPPEIVAPEPASEKAAEPARVVSAMKPPVTPPARALKVSLRTRPAGAEVSGATGRLGRTPLEVELRPGTRAAYRFTLAGYRAQTREISAEDRVVELQLALEAAPSPALPPPEALDKLDAIKPNPFD